MVKGVCKQVVLVRPGNSDIFEQAIFVLRGDETSERDVTEEELLRQARQAVEDVRSPRRRRLFALTRLLCAGACGGACVGAVWLVSVLL